MGLNLRKAALDHGRQLGPRTLQLRKDGQMAIVDRLIRHEFITPKPPSNSVLVRRYFKDYPAAVRLANGNRASRDRLAIVGQATFLDYVKEIGAFYRNPAWRRKHL